MGVNGFTSWDKEIDLGIPLGGVSSVTLLRGNEEVDKAAIDMPGITMPNDHREG